MQMQTLYGIQILISIKLDWKITTPICLYYWLLSWYNSRIEQWKQDHLAYKASNTYYLFLYKRQVADHCPIALAVSTVQNETNMWGHLKVWLSVSQLIYVHLPNNQILNFLYYYFFDLRSFIFSEDLLIHYCQDNGCLLVEY